MQIKKICDYLKGQVVTCENNLDEDIEYSYSCDLMSDVLAFVKNDIVLLTGLLHPQVIRTAEMLDVKAIVFVRGKEPDEEMKAMATRKNITLITTHLSLFNASGILYEAGLRGEEIE